MDHRGQEMRRTAAANPNVACHRMTLADPTKCVRIRRRADIEYRRGRRCLQDIGSASLKAAALARKQLMAMTITKEAQSQYPYFTEEHQMFRETVKQFVEAEIAPHAEEWDEAGIFPRELFKKAANLGLFGIRLDPKYGGSGLDWGYTAAYLESFSYANNGGLSLAMFLPSPIPF